MSVADDFPLEHEWAVAQLPWYVNGRLQPADQLRLSAHLKRCEACRLDLEVERRLAQGLSARPVVDYSPQASLSRMMQAIDRSERRRTWLPWRSRARRAGDRGASARPSLIGVVIAQAAGLAVLATALAWLAIRPSPEAAYRTLSRPAAAVDAQLQVVFVDHATVSQMRSALAGVSGAVIAGPSRAGAFQISLRGAQQGDAVSAAAVAAAVTRLRGDPAVLYVAPLNAAAAP